VTVYLVVQIVPDGMYRVISRHPTFAEASLWSGEGMIVVRDGEG
jgi:hypothetical protein